MLKILRQRDFFLLWVGQFISVIGDWVLFIALPFYTYDLTGSVLATGAMFIVSTLPRIALGSVAGVFVDRWDRKRTMIVADFARVLLISTLLFVRSSSGLWLIYVSAFLESIVAQFFNPAKSAIIPLMVDEKDLLPANSLNGLSDALTRLLGSALGGVLIGWLGFSSVVLLDAGTFLFSGLMIMLIVLPGGARLQPEIPASPSSSGMLSVWHEWLDGLRLVKQERLLLMLFLVLDVALLGDSMITVLIVPLVKDLMGGSAQLLGWLMMSEGLGGLLGGLLVGKIGTQFPARCLITGGLIFTGVFFFIIISFPQSILALIFMALIGMVASAWSISSETLLQLTASDQFRGRIFGALGTTTAMASLLGMLISSLLTGLVGLLPILIISASLYFFSGVLAWFTLPVLPHSQTAQSTSLEPIFVPIQDS